jgi:hypothetical protein
MGFGISGIAQNGSTMTLRSVMCKQTSAKVCPSCALLGEDSYLKGIISQLEEGVKESTNLMHFGIGGLHEIIRQKDGQNNVLRLGKLTVARTLSSKVAAIEDWKRLYVALGSGKVPNCE